MSAFDDDPKSVTALSSSLIDAFAEFWHGGEGPGHSVIDRKIISAGLPVGQGSKEQKIIDAFVAAPSDAKAYRLMVGLLDALRQFAEWPLKNTDRGVRLRKAIEAAGYSLNDDFEICDGPLVPEPRHPQDASAHVKDSVSASKSAWEKPWQPQSEAQFELPSSTVVTEQEKREIQKAEVKAAPPKEIFLVHGHDDLKLHEVSRWIRQLTGVEPIVLREQINRGKTLIEKFESYSSDAACAVVIMTPDDEGRAKREAGSELQAQARPNVVFEMGYFFGKLKRENVLVLNFGVVEPGDIRGLVYIPEENWQLNLGRELAGLGYPAHL